MHQEEIIFKTNNATTSSNTAVASADNYPCATGIEDSNSSIEQRLKVYREGEQRDEALRRQSSPTTTITAATTCISTARAVASAAVEANDCDDGCSPSGTAKTPSDHCLVTASDRTTNSSNIPTNLSRSSSSSSSHCSTSTTSTQVVSNNGKKMNMKKSSCKTSNKDKYSEEFNNRDNEKPLKSVLAAACQCLGFDIAEMWLQTGPTTHQLIHCYFNDGTHSTTSSTSPASQKDNSKNDKDGSKSHNQHCPRPSLSSSVSEKTLIKLKEVYHSKDAPYKVHTLSPALCKKARQVNGIIHISTETDSGSKVLQSSLCDVVYAAAVPVKYIGHQQQQRHHNRHGYGDRTFLSNVSSARTRNKSKNNANNVNKPRLERIEEDSFQPNTNLTVIYFGVTRPITVQPSTNEFLAHITFAAVDLGMNFFVNHPNQKKTRERHRHHHQRHHNHHNREEKSDNDQMNINTSSTSSNNSDLSYSSTCSSSSSSSSGSKMSYEDDSNYKIDEEDVVGTDGAAAIDDSTDISLNDNCVTKNRVPNGSSKKGRKTKKQVILGPVRNELDNEEQQGCIRVRQAAVADVGLQINELGSYDPMNDNSNDDSDGDDHDIDNDFDNIVLDSAETNDDNYSVNNNEDGLTYRRGMKPQITMKRRSMSMGCLRQD